MRIWLSFQNTRFVLFVCFTLLYSLLQACARMRNEKRSTKVQTIEKRGGVTTNELRNVYPTGVKAAFSMSI